MNPSQVENYSKSEKDYCGSMLDYLAMPEHAPVTLSEYVRKVMQEKSLSATDVERRSKGGITQSYVSQIVNRGIESITTKKLDALAKGLGVPRLELYRVAAGGGPEEDAEFRQSAIYMLFEKSKNASPENKQAIDMLIDMLLDRLDRKTGS